MDKCSVYLCFIVTVFITVNCVSAKESCDGSCVKSESCQFFGNLQKQEQSSWLERFDCRGQAGQGSEHVYGFSQSAIGDLVCCPENVWQVDNSQSNPQTSGKKQAVPEPDNPPMEKNSYGYQPGHAGANYNYDYPGYGGNQYRNQHENRYGNDDYGPGSSTDDETTMLENTRLWQNRRHERNRPSNPYFMPANNNNGGYNNGGSSYRAPSPDPQCVITSYPPDPNTGCCGREANEEDRVAASQYPNKPRNSWTRDPWMSYSDSEDSASRKKRASVGDTDPTVNVQVGNRIAGGKETELEQFPWTVLLKTTFTYPDKESSFSCGGSLISSRYVLTAGHCVYDQKGSIKQLEVNLAEYDKRTFPKDCKNVLGKGQQCVENIIILAESVNIHPQYDDSFLHNDIALIRLRENAPYTDYIRPICLPPINVDTPDLSQLRLAVAGWGRNGQYRSNIKQSTVVNLVPNDQCAISYPGLTKQQLCAAGYSGEDTCKGDSGGPLMMVYGGKYYISGVVSGKRADAPCGTSVPSLYTNVYMYLSWIKSIISN